MADTQIVLDDIQEALKAAQSYLPSMLAVVGTFWPPAAAIAKFLPLIAVAIEAIEQVQKATNSTPQSAFDAVVAHLTPGEKNAPALS